MWTKIRTQMNEEWEVRCNFVLLRFSAFEGENYLAFDVFVKKIFQEDKV